MNPEPSLTEDQRAAIESFRLRHRATALTFLFADFAGATEPEPPPGDTAAASSIQGHPSIVRELLGASEEAEEVAATDDSLFVVFLRSSDALLFALQTQKSLQSSSEETKPAPPARIGIHAAAVSAGQANAEAGDDPLSVPAQIARCLMAIGAGGQTLVTGGAFHRARRALDAKTLSDLPPLSWASYGFYSIEGVEEPIEICEVGAAGVAPLSPPPDGEHARRCHPPGWEIEPGWRPAVQQVVPHTDWITEELLGCCDSGETWRAKNPQKRETRVFRFFFDADRVRSLRSERQQFGVLKDALGSQPDVATLHSVALQDIPYLEREYVDGDNLKDWIARRGGFDQVTLDDCLEVVAQVADAVGAAHANHIVHRGIKPTNILIRERKDGSFQACVTDFLIGEDIAAVRRAQATGMLDDDTERGAYIAPEVIRGAEPTPKSDIYSLGVLLYEMVTANFYQVLPDEWGHVLDPVLRRDIRQCVARRPGKRPARAEVVAKQIRSLRTRHATRHLGRVAKCAVAVIGILLIGFIAYSLIADAVRRSRRYRPRPVTRTTVARPGPVPRPPAVAQPRTVPTPRGLEMATLRGHSGTVASVAFSPDGRRLATVDTADRRVRTWNVSTASQMHSLMAHTKTVWAVTFSADGSRIATASADKTACVFEATQGRRLNVLRGHAEGLHAVAFSPVGNRLATGGHDKTIKIWNHQTALELRTLKGHDDTIFCVAFSRDGKQLASASWDKTVKLWDVETGREIRTFKGHTAGLESVAFSPDAKRLLTSSRDGTARVFDAETGRELGMLPADAGGLKSAAFSPDGKLIATAGYDTTCKIWDARTSRALLTLPGHRGHVFSAAFSPNGNRLATGSADSTAKLWNVQKLLGDRNKLYACAVNLLTIHDALVRYRADNNGQMPNWLSELRPKYLRPEVLLCPANRNPSRYVRDPNQMCSYDYQWAPVQLSASPRTVYRNVRAQNLREYGDIVPTARCRNHGSNNILDLSYGGSLFVGTSVWESTVRRDHGTTIAAAPCIIPPRALFRAAPVKGTTTTIGLDLLKRAPGSTDEFAALMQKFRIAEGPRAEWEKLPALAKSIAGHPTAQGMFLNNTAWQIVDTQRRHPEVCLILAHAAIERSPNTGIILDTVGWAELLAGNNETALDFFKRAIVRESGQSKSISQAGMAIALARLGRVDMAWNTLRTSVQSGGRRQYHKEAYSEVAKAGKPRSQNSADYIRQRLGPSPKAEVEFKPANPRPGEPVQVLYRSWLSAHNSVGQVVIHWGVNRWQDPGKEAAVAIGARRTYWADTSVPAGIQQSMYREGDAWAAVLHLPPDARRLDLTFFAETQPGTWIPRERDYSTTVSASANNTADDKATTSTQAEAVP